MQPVPGLYIHGRPARFEQNRTLPRPRWSRPLLNCVQDQQDFLSIKREFFAWSEGGHRHLALCANLFDEMPGATPGMNLLGACPWDAPVSDDGALL